MKYRTSTWKSKNSNYIFQVIFDSEDYMFFCVLYTVDGLKVKHCKKADTENGAIENMDDLFYKLS